MRSGAYLPTTNKTQHTKKQILKIKLYHLQPFNYPTSLRQKTFSYFKYTRKSKIKTTNLVYFIYICCCK